MRYKLSLEERSCPRGILQRGAKDPPKYPATAPNFGIQMREQLCIDNSTGESK